VARICEYIRGATQKNASYRLLSVDEKPGIQALARHSTPMKSGQLHREEFEYKRNGTTCLTAATEVNTDKIVHSRMSSTNNTADFVTFFLVLAKMFPCSDKIIILLDNLSTHSTPDLVRAVAQVLNYKGDLGKVGSRGILKNVASRKEFLEDHQHRIQFLFTPVHCSWLNPIENWFSKLQRQMLTRNSFNSLTDLKKNIQDYIQYYNMNLSKIIKWKFSGFVKNKPLAA